MAHSGAKLEIFWKKHWHVLTMSPSISLIVGPQPLITARSALNLNDTLAHSEFQRTQAKNWLMDFNPIRGMHTSVNMVC